MIITSFYTAPYRSQVDTLIKSLQKFRLIYDVQEIKSRGNWKANCLYRSTFLIDMMEKYNDDVVWLDADAEIMSHPSLLYSIPQHIDLAFYNREGREFLLGTSYWKNSPLVKYLLMEWISICDPRSAAISQKDFMRLFQSKYVGKLEVQLLPESYCHIFDKPSQETPVIVHHQASRRLRRMIEEEAEKNNSAITIFQTQAPAPEPILEQPFPIVLQMPVEKLPPDPSQMPKVETEVHEEVPESVPDIYPYYGHSVTRKRIFLPLNQTNWAFDFRCTALERYLIPYFDIRKVSGYDVAKKGLGFQADLVYWPTYESLDTMGGHCHRTCATIGGLVIRSLAESVDHFGKALAIAVPNKTWYDQYLAKNLPIKFYLIPNGVDTEVFCPPKSKSNHEFIVGWVGNDRPDRAKIKRIEELRRVCHKLGITLLEQGKSAQIDHDKMPSFYQRLDLYVNLSITEGSNNCILEAAACGVPILGTEVGNMSELKEAGAFTVRHDLEDLEEQLRLIRDLSNRKQIGEAMREEMVKNYTSEQMAMRYKAMFDYCLSLEEGTDESK